MDSLFSFSPASSRRSTSVPALVSVWICGLLLGAVVSCGAGSDLSSLMRTVCVGRVSFAGLLAVCLLPFLLSAFAVYLRSPWLLIPIAFLKAFIFGWATAAVAGAYGSAGWLIRLLLMFSDCLLTPMLFWYWVRHIDAEPTFEVWDIGGLLIAAVLVICLDYRTVAPFLAAVLS